MPRGGRRPSLVSRAHYKDFDLVRTLFHVRESRRESALAYSRQGIVGKLRVDIEKRERKVPSRQPLSWKGRRLEELTRRVFGNTFGVNQRPIGHRF